MSFSFTAVGTRDEAVVQLEDLTPTQLGQDPMGAEVRDFAARALRRSADVGMGQQFKVTASGHAGSEEYTSVTTMTMSIAVENVPQAQPEHVAQQEAAGTVPGSA